MSKQVAAVIKKALSAEFKLEDETTRARDHATELAHDAVDRGFDAVVAFGGDGTTNEVAQALVGTDVPLGILPGGTTNVLARSLGIARDPVVATDHLAAHLRTGSSRRIGVGEIADRYFLLCCGMGLDAEVVRRVEADARAGKPKNEWAFLKHALAAGSTEYRTREPVIDVEVRGQGTTKALFVVCCNARPLTYFKGLPIEACPEAALDRALDLLTMRKLSLPMIPRIALSVFVTRSHVRWRTTDYYPDFTSAALHSTQPDPIQVDGDYIGERQDARIRYLPDALSIFV